MERKDLLRRRNALSQDLRDMEDVIQWLPAVGYRKNETRGDRDDCIRRFEARALALREEYHATFREATS